MSPALILSCCFATCLSAGAALLFLSESSLGWLCALVAVLGAGMAPIYASAMMWMEGTTKVLYCPDHPFIQD